MQPVNVNFTTPMRDPTGNAERFIEIHGLAFDSLNENQFDRYQASGVACWIIERGVAMYSRGDPVVALAGRLVQDLPCLQAQLGRFVHEDATDWTDKDRALFGLVQARQRRHFGYLALGLTLLPDKGTLQALLGLLNNGPEQRLFGVDLLLKAFNPTWAPAKKYVRDKSPWSADRWGDAVVRVMAAPPEQRSAALHLHMSRWGTLMKPFGWKPVRDFSTEAAEKRGELESLFGDFAFEAAMAVCAYDIDDSSFRDHLYYPRDLVDYYRAHVRHTRDAWRGEGVGPGVPVQPPPAPQRADLAKSKRKGLARWLELASDGDAEAVDAVLDAHGAARKVTDLSALGCAMAEQGIAVHADIKDDDTLLSQLDALADTRGLGGFEAPAGIPAAGPDRCEALLQAAAAWLSQRGYRLRSLDVEDDAWSAALVRTDHFDEWLSLGERLGIASSDPAHD